METGEFFKMIIQVLTDLVEEIKLVNTTLISIESNLSDYFIGARIKGPDEIQ